MADVGVIDGLVTCAGIRTRSMIVDTSLANWERHLRVNLTGIWLAARAMLRSLPADGSEVTTVEGLSGPFDGRSAVQEGFRQCHGLQCGYCAPGMLMAATGLIEESGGDISDEEIREGLEGNLCRCTGYEMIVRSARWAIDNASS